MVFAEWTATMFDCHSLNQPGSDFKAHGAGDIRMDRHKGVLYQSLFHEARSL